jgi:hypothetical protein
MTKLNVSDDLKLPLDVITMATAILGLRGSGKTNTAGVWTEELLKVGQQVIVIDPQNVWWGLKSTADGKQAGFPIVIFGGDHADVPITGTEGKQLADFVVENRVPCIFSLRHLSLSAQRRFVTALTEQIFFRKGEAKYQTPALVVIDEAHKFVPQKVQGDDMAMLVHRIQMLVTEGRASGIGVTLIDQRAATVNKDVLTQIELMVVHRTVGPQDKKALDEWIRDNAEEGQAEVFKQSLAKLSIGEAWFWSVGWLDVFKKVQVRMRETFDSSRTPRPGEKRITPKNLAEVDLEKLKTELAETLEKAKADDPKELKRQISELKRQISKPAAVEVQTKEVVKTVKKEVPVIKDSQLVKAEKIIERINQQIRQLQDVRDHIDIAVGKFNAMREASEPAKALVAAVGATRTFDRPVSSAPKTLQKQVESTQNLKTAVFSDESAGDVEVGGLHSKVLNALAELESFGLNQPTRGTLGFYLGKNLQSGWGSRCVSDLKTSGLVDYPTGGALALTDAGRGKAAQFNPPNSRTEFHDRVRRHIGGLHQSIFDYLVQIYPSSISREDLGDPDHLDKNLQSGWGSRCVSDLRTAGLVDYPQSGWLRATDVLFPEGLS